MHNPYIIFADDGSDLTREIIDEYNCGIVTMHCKFKKAEYTYLFNDNDNYKDFYNKIRDGFTAHTYPLTPNEYAEKLSPYIEKGLDILFISFSSYLSESYNNLCKAKNILKEKYPSRSLIIVDSKRASASIALMVTRALEMQSNGKTIGEVYQWLERYKISYHSLFVIDDIFYIINEDNKEIMNNSEKKSTLPNSLAHLAMLANIKPILHIDTTGKIDILEKTIGKKRAIQHICDIITKKAYSPESSILYISHGDSFDTAMQLKNILESKIKFKKIKIIQSGPMIGAHIGADTLGVSYIGEG